LTNATATAVCPVECVPLIKVYKQVVCSPCEPFSNDLNSQKTATGVKVDANCPAFCYRITVTNTSNVLLSNLTVVDDSVPDPDLNLGGCGFPTTLAPGASATCVVSNVTHCSNTVNVITATASGPTTGGGTTQVSSKDTNSVVVIPIAITCAVEAPTNCISVGSNYTVTVRVTNSGQYDLQNVMVTNVNGLTCFSSPTNIGSLAVGASKTVTCNFTCSEPGTNNYAAAVSGEASQSGVHICDKNSQGQQIRASSSCNASVCCQIQDIKVCIVKEIVCFTPAGCADDWRKVATGVKRLDEAQCPAFCYRFTVSNCSNSPIVINSISDDVLGDIKACAGFNFISNPVLLPGESRICIVSNVFHCDDTTNTVTVVAQSSIVSSLLSTNHDSAIALIKTVDIDCTKIVTSPDDLDNNPFNSFVTLLQDGLTHFVTNTVIVRNLGEVDLTNVTIHDPLLEGAGCIMPAPFTLAAGESQTFVLCLDAITTTDEFCAGGGRTNTIMIEAMADAGTNNFCVYDQFGSNVTVRTDCSAYISCKKPGACRTTDGGRQDANQGHVDPRFPEVRYVTHGGQVGAPVGNAGFDPDSDCIHGRWTHVRHMKGGLKGNFHARFYDSLLCACLGGVDCTNVTPVTGRLCNAGDRVCGPEPRKAPANKICFSGVGDYTLTNGRRTPRSTLFRVDIEDRSEPGGAHPKGGTPPPDRYRIRIWVLTSSELAALNGPSKLCSFRKAISCSDVNTPLKDGALDANGNAVALGTAVFGQRAPDIDDGGDLDRGNSQIHPQIKDCDKAPHSCPLPQ